MSNNSTMYHQKHVTMATVAAKFVEDTLYTNSYTHILASGLVVPGKVSKFT